MNLHRSQNVEYHLAAHTKRVFTGDMFDVYNKLGNYTIVLGKTPVMTAIRG